jgi:pyrimidine operon attenuation protein/uracil phosphoribosyltransferase
MAKLDVKIDDLVAILAEQIIKDYKYTDDLVFIGIKSRGDEIAKRIVAYLKVEIPVFDIRISFYSDDLTQLSDQPKIIFSHIKESLDQKQLIIVDDVFYTGATVLACINHLKTEFSPANIRVAALVKRDGSKIPYPLDYFGYYVDLSLNQYVKVQIAEVEGVDSISVNTK